MILELIDIVKGAAPHLWQIARTQVRIDMYVNAFIAALSFIMLGVIAFFSFITWREDEYIDEIGALLIIVWSLIGLVVLIGTATSAIYRAANPDYYAIRVLMGLVP